MPGAWLRTHPVAADVVQVTVLVEVPIVQAITSWTVPTLPADWAQLRDRWVSCHLVRVVAGVAGLGCLVGAVVFPTR
jgi:hypothetical protein